MFEVSHFFISFTFPCWVEQKKLLEVFPMSTWDMTSNLWEQNTLGGRGHNPKFAKRTDCFFYKTTQKYIPAEVFTKRFWSSISFGICFSMSVEMRNTPGLQVSMSQNSNFFGKWFYDLRFQVSAKDLAEVQKLYLGICCLKNISGCFLWEGLGSS